MMLRTIQPIPRLHTSETMIWFVSVSGDVETLLDMAHRDALRQAISYAMQFALRKSVVISGKARKVWSQAGQGQISLYCDY